MVALDVLALALALAGANDAVLLEFSAEWCGPCRAVAPTVDRLAREGYPVRRIDIDQQPQLASQYGITGVPCFVMLAGGREIGRVTGAASYDRLVQLINSAKPAVASAATTAPSSSPGSAVQTVPASSFVAAAPSPSSERAPVSADVLPVSAGSKPATDPRRRALAATVRIRVEDPQGQSVGTGTVIDVHGAEALVVTCGHLFRESAGKGTILVDLFVHGASRAVPGHLLSWNADHDVALLAIQPGVEIDPVPVAPPGYRIQQNQPVFTLGCSRGDQPTIQTSHITAIDKYLGPPNLEVAGQPVDGRSGGGLFSAEGMLIGICNAADPADGEGIYAALPSIHWELDRIGQQRIYQPDSRATLAAAETSTTVPANDRAPLREQVEQPAPSPVGPSRPELVEVSATADWAKGEVTEVICVVRQRGQLGEREQVYIVRQPSHALLQQLQQESNAPTAVQRETVPLQAHSEPASPAAWPRMPTPGGAPAIRAQSP